MIIMQDFATWQGFLNLLRERAQQPSNATFEDMRSHLERIGDYGIQIWLVENGAPLREVVTFDDTLVEHMGPNMMFGIQFANESEETIFRLKYV